MENAVDTLKIIPMDAPLGAEISGINLSQDLDKVTVDRILQAFYDHKVIFFRGQKLTDPQLVGFAKHFGDPEHIHHPTNLAILGLRAFLN